MASGKLRILLAERDLSAAEEVKSLLERFYQIEVVSDGLEALHLARELRPDLVITSILLPQVDGFQICRELKSRAETAGIPILVISSLLAENRIKQAGADAFLPKPTDGRALRHTVARLLGTQRQR